MLSAEVPSTEMAEDVNQKLEPSGTGGLQQIEVLAVTPKTMTPLVTVTTETEEMAQLTLPYNDSQSPKLPSSMDTPGLGK